MKASINSPILSEAFIESKSIYIFYVKDFLVALEFIDFAYSVNYVSGYTILFEYKDPDTIAIKHVADIIIIVIILF